MVEQSRNGKGFVWQGVIAAIVSGVVSAMGWTISVERAAVDPSHPLRAASQVAHENEERLDIVDKRLDAMSQQIISIADQRIAIASAQRVFHRKLDSYAKEADAKYQELSKENTNVFHTVMRKLEQMESALEKK